MASVAWVRDPLQTVLTERDLRPVDAGMSIAALAPAWPEAFVCVIDGVPIGRAQWAEPVREGETVVFIAVPAGGGGSNPLRTLLTVALLYFAPQLAPQLKLAGIATDVSSAAITAGAFFAGQALINSLLPLPSQAQGGSVQASPTYSAQLSGNAARLDQARPVLYGINRTFPDFASQPYSAFDGDDQYYHAILLVTEGHMQALSVEIDDTPIGNFSDVQYKVIGPGQADGTTLAAQTLVEANHETSSEVAGQDLLDTLWIGPFAATRAGRACNRIHIDIVCPRGLGQGSGGGLTSRSVQWQVQARLIDDAGAALGNFTTLGNETITAATATPVRRSYSYTVAAGRYQVRLRRTDVRSSDVAALHDAQWFGLRARRTDAGVTVTTATYVVVRMRASEQLSGLSQRRIAVLSQRLLPIWNGTTWSAPTATRAIAWALADICRNASYGRGLADSRIDLVQLLALDAVWAARQDRFDFAFDTRTTTFDALALAARAGRAAPLLRNGVYTFVRDGAQTLPVGSYSRRNMLAGTFGIDYALPTEEAADAVDVEYWSGARWAFRTVRAQYANGAVHVYDIETGPPAGVSPTTRVVRMRLPGVIGRKQALREAAYMAADNVWHRRVASWNSSTDGLLVAPGSLVMVQHDVPQWGQAADIALWTAGTLTATLTEPMTWTEAASHFVRLHKPDGSVTSAIAVTRGAADNVIVLGVSPGFDVVFDDASRERTRIIFGAGTTQAVPARVRSIKPRRAEVEMQARIEDARVHAADNAHLPATGETQDPIGLPTGGGGGASEPIVNLTSHGDLFNVGGAGIDVWFELLNDGRAHGIVATLGGDTYFSSEWIVQAPVSSSTAGLYEARATVLEFSTPTGAAVGSWLNLGTTRRWTINGIAGGEDRSRLLIEIRLAATQEVLASGTMYLYITSGL